VTLRRLLARLDRALGADRIRVVDHVVQEPPDASGLGWFPLDRQEALDDTEAAYAGQRD